MYLEIDWGNYIFSVRDDNYFLGYLDSYIYKYIGIEYKYIIKMVWYSSYRFYFVKVIML